MKLNINFTTIAAVLFIVFLFCACTRNRNVILRPDPLKDMLEQAEPQEIWLLIASQNGSPEEGIPEWLSLYMDTGISGVESLSQYSDKHILIGENRGTNLIALKQWANAFSEMRDFPGLLVQRVERRLVSSASLYPDDEYGDFFVNMIRQVSDGEYPGVVKDQIFWIKQKRLPLDEEDGYDPVEIQSNFISERYKIFVLLAIDKEVLQRNIQQLMDGIITPRSTTREQNAAINRIRATFFEGF